MLSAPIKERRDGIEGKGREGHVRTGTQITAIWSPAKECLASTEAQRGKAGFLTRAFRESMTCGHLELRHLASTTVKE